MTKKKYTSDIDILIGQRLRELRCANRRTQIEVASACGITFQQIQKYERGTNRISTSRLIEVCKAIEVSPSVFIADIAAQSNH